MNNEQAKELTNVIYDTLMQNTQHPQFNLECVDCSEVNAGYGIITFEYDGAEYQLTVQPLNATT